MYCIAESRASSRIFQVEFINGYAGQAAGWRTGALYPERHGHFADAGRAVEEGACSIYPQAKWIQYDPVNRDSARIASKAFFGDFYDAQYKLDRRRM